MACYYPVGCQNNDGIATKRPCGMCLGCRLDRSREWAIRCYHEAQMHEENCFVTLTYNDENLPEDGSVHVLELQKFMKRLRKKIDPKRVRFFGCGEYGEKLNRPHYHVCLFGYDFPNKKILRTSSVRAVRGGYKKKSDYLYRSKELEKLWKKGFSTIGRVTYESAAYVARYVCKKFVQSATSKRINGDGYKKHYGNKLPEFSAMSRGNAKTGGNGIGKSWFEKHYNEIYSNDCVIVNGRKQRIPRYYDQLYEKMNHVEMFKIKEKRRKKSLERYPETTLRGKGKEYHKELVTKTLKRGLEENGNN